MKLVALCLISLSGLALAITQASALTAFLQGSGEVSGTFRYCSYSNGETYTVNSIDLCPMSVETGISYSSPVTGFLVDEYEDGLSKVCIYDVLGQQKGIRFSGVTLCPLNEEF